MPYVLKQWPGKVYPDELAEFPEAEADIDVALNELRKQGPSPDGYNVKNLGKKMGGLWQMNLKIQKRQIRILYAPYRDAIVVFRIHKKSSLQEQAKAYSVAIKRKTAVDKLIQEGKLATYEQLPSIH